MTINTKLVQALTEWNSDALKQECRLIYVLSPNSLSIFTIDMDVGRFIRSKKSLQNEQQVVTDYYNMKIGVFIPEKIIKMVKDILKRKPDYETGEFHIQKQNWRVIPKLTEELVEIHRIKEKVDNFNQGTIRYSSRLFGKKKAIRIAQILKIKKYIGGKDIYDQHDSRYFGGALAFLPGSVGKKDTQSTEKTQYIFGSIAFYDDFENPDILSIYQELPDVEEKFQDWIKDQSELSLAMGPGFKSKTISLNFRFNNHLIEELQKIY